MALVVLEDESQDVDAGQIREDSLRGLAESWEASLSIRQRFRKTGSLLEWPSEETAGIPSMTLEWIFMISCSFS